ncbi:MAG: hypothetical protein K2K34_00685, partial [Oscillospiraceae bacterium]|nr:hypothetical protein [Oscillospiraceae bacterium]
MKKRLIVMALSACLLTACSAEDTANAGDNINGETAAVTAESMTEITENAAETTETTETTEISAETIDETKAETSENEVTTGTNPLD